MISRRSLQNVIAAAGVLVVGTLLIPGAGAEAPPPPGATAVHVRAGHQTRGVDVHLPATKFGSISGQVLESGSGQPLRRIRVEAYVSPHRIIRNAFTGRDGTYHLALPAYASGYLICFRRDPVRAWETVGTSTTGWAPQCLGNRVWAGTGASVPANTRTAPVRAGQDTPHIDASLQPGGVLAGRVTRRGSGDAGTEARVYVRSVGAPHYRKRDYTDGEGNYELSNLPAAPHGYQLCFDVRHENHPDNDVPHPVVSRCYGGVVWRNMPQPANGQSIPSIPNWNTVHWPTSAKRVAVHAGSVRRGLDVQVDPAATIVGRLVDRSDGTPVSAPDVYAFDDSGRILGKSVVADNSGGFRMTWLPTANVHLCVDPTIYYGGWRTSYQRMCYRNSLWTDHASTTNGTAVRVVRGQTRRGIVIWVPHASTIEGRLTSAVDGSRVVGSVVLFSSHGTRLAQAHTGGRSNGGVSNRYSFGSVPASRSGYVVCATAIRTGPSGLGLRPTCYTHGRWDGAARTRPTGATPIPLGAHDHARGVDLALRPGGAISGAIDPSGRLTLFDDRGHRVHVPSGKYSAGLHFRRTWSISGLDPAHTYRVCFRGWPGPLNHKPTCYPNAKWYRP